MKISGEILKKEKRLLYIFLLVFISVVFVSSISLAENPELEELNQAYEELKNRTQKLENRLEKYAGEAPIETEESDNDMDELSAKNFGGIFKETSIGGCIELEAFYEHFSPHNAADEKNSSIDVASVEMYVNSNFAHRLSSIIVFDYEKNHGVTIDEALIHFQAFDTDIPDFRIKPAWFASAGKMDLPFGRYESHLLSDPIVKELGETHAVSILLGLYHKPFTISISVFNGEMDQMNRSDYIESYVVSVNGYFELLNGVELSVGTSYISNLAESNSLAEFLNNEYLSNESDDATTDKDVRLKEYIPGISSYLSLSFIERLFINLEYVSALRRFEEDRMLKPSAWNAEIAFLPMEDLAIAVGYGESFDTLDFLPEMQYSAAVVYDMSDRISVGFDALLRKFLTNDEINRLSMKFGVSF